MVSSIALELLPLLVPADVLLMPVFSTWGALPTGSPPLCLSGDLGLTLVLPLFDPGITLFSFSLTTAGDGSLPPTRRRIGGLHWAKWTGGPLTGGFSLPWRPVSFLFLSPSGFSSASSAAVPSPGTSISSATVSPPLQWRCFPSSSARTCGSWWGPRQFLLLQAHLFLLFFLLDVWLLWLRSSRSWSWQKVDHH